MSDYITEVMKTEVGDKLTIESGYLFNPVSTGFTARLTCPNGVTHVHNFTLAPHSDNITVSEGPSSYRLYEERTRERNRASFKKIVQSGAIKMSYYDWRRTKTTCYAARVEKQASLVEVTSYRNGQLWKGVGPDHKIQCSSQGPFYELYPAALGAKWLPGFKPGQGSAWPVAERLEFEDHYYNGHYVPPPLPSYHSELETLKSNLVSQLYKRWDLMTDLVEVKSSYRTLNNVLGKSISPLSRLKQATRGRKSKLSLKESANASRNQWLEYRYGVMPLVYSATDALGVLRNRTVEFDTVRGSFTQDLNDTFDLGEYRVERVGTRQVRGVGKARYTGSLNRLQNSISFNLINTGWEITRYSLVVDWFANVGDFLTASTTSFNADHNFCYAVDERFTDLVYKIVDGKAYLVLSYSHESYARVPFTNKDVILHFRNNFSGWKRWLDAIALSAGPLTKAIRRLK